MIENPGAYAMNNAPKCGASTERGPCKRAAAANGRCSVHGGRNPAGPSHPRFTGQRRTTYTDRMQANKKLMETYVDVINDPELLNLSDEIALMKAHIADLIEKITQSGDTEDRWDRARDAWNRFVKARRAKIASQYAEALRELETVFTEQHTDKLLWDDIHDSLVVLDKLVGRENKRRATMQAMLSTEQAVALLARMVSIIQDNVTDPKAIDTIHKEVRRLLVDNPSLASGIGRVDARKKESYFKPGDLPESIEAALNV